ncbi:bifunctional protein HldE [Microtetraspora sp. NBRC 13810]|uniref:PfkB family carbohydrate kinase n=1 Tax=Microtetraspora sp. NBRC 13810 TaxID=3030990 RepID=UPI0024A31347|nr:PfkB family carbohydrate kinase [Microtetraspora sp. NBRC 13810]GLW05373.1 bifunctional protein HldE [Microtetraspora sp. NBRC 13810]
MTDRFIEAVVVGDVMLDSWLRGPVSRVAQEAPVPVVSVREDDDAPGGAGNTAANLAALGARVQLLGVIGDDPCGERLTRELRLRGVETFLPAVPGRRTAHRRRLMTGGRLVARYDEEDREPIPPQAERALIARLREAASSAHVVIACDHAAGVCTPAVRRALTGLPLLVVDAHAVAPWRGCSAAVLPSYRETLRLLGEEAAGGAEEDRAGFLAARTARLLAVTGAELVVTALDGEGTLLHQRGRQPYRTYAEPAPAHMAAGTGDTYTAVFALWLAAGAVPEEAARTAQAAAGVVARRPGTTVCTWHELLRALRGTDGVVRPAERVAERLDEHRRRGERIVFTHGCFDGLRRGHVAYLEQARRLGDVLVVAVHGDASVTRLKGAGRPVNPCADRMSALAALNHVDYVTWFEEDTPERLIRMIRPDLYVRGGDHPPGTLPESPVVRALGGEVMTLGHVAGRSSGEVIERIRAFESGGGTAGGHEEDEPVA